MQIIGFLDQPCCEDVYAPVGVQVNFTCSVDEGYTSDWTVRLPDMDMALSTSNRHDPARLAQRSIFGEGFGTNMTTLSVSIHEETGNETNNQTMVTCIATETSRTFSESIGNRVKIIFYGMWCR